MRLRCTKQNKLVEYTKTRRARNVPVPRAILDLLADKRNLAPEAHIFSSLWNSYGHRKLKPLMRAAGVPEIKLHSFRHTYASHLLAAGVNVMQVKELLGHTKLDSTMKYLHLVDNNLSGITGRIVADAPYLSEPTDNVIKLSKCTRTAPDRLNSDLTLTATECK